VAKPCLFNGPAIRLAKADSHSHHPRWPLRIRSAGEGPPRGVAYFLSAFISSAVLIVWVGAANAATLSPEEAAKHIGENARVCGLVASATYAANVTTAPTFLDFGNPYPNQIFTAVILGSDREKFGTPELTLRGKQICVAGVIFLYQGKPQMILQDPNQISER
jgi:hypothetical protein